MFSNLFYGVCLVDGSMDGWWLYFAYHVA